LKILASIALLAALASPCLAQDTIGSSAYKYYTVCSAPTGLNDALCVNYSVGLFNGLQVFNDFYYEQTGRDFYSLPDNVTYGQMMLIVLKYMADNPQRLNERTAALAGTALMKAYPPKGAR
jgi:hypothetical protein